jgi:primosomal protein N' (replication factor Y)
MSTSAAKPEPLYAEVHVALRVSQTFSYALPLLDPVAQVRVGSVVRVPFGRRKLWGVIRALSPTRPAVARLREILTVMPEPYVIGDDHMRLCDWLSDYYACSPGEALALSLPPQPGTKGRRAPWGKAEEPELPLVPSLEQQRALDAIASCLGAEARHGSFLLHGVTGSGKTEVYLRVIDNVLKRGGSALMLLPEIALTPQTMRRLQRRFPGKVAPYHSRLSQGERCMVWERAASGELPIVVGARSAVLLPMPKLGVIVVDEEHEGSFKSDKRPRHHARDVALMRARLAGIPILLGSATPSLESYHNAREGKHTLLHLPSRLGADSLPAVRIVDRRVRDASGRIETLSDDLAATLEGVLDRGEQAIILHNRRGFARYLQCHSCGHVIDCPNCDISMTYHLADDRLRCHYCDHRRPVPDQCADCGMPGLRSRGSGTQRVELALQSRFPAARVLRLDQDSARRKEAHADILRCFGDGEADILLGTQMVAKGLHFPRVSLVGVVDADSGLHFPDFRAHEKAFQLLTQVAGRSGRTGPGEVIFQSFDPEHRVLAAARDQDVEGFLECELLQRQALGYPPARRLAAVGASCTDGELLDEALARLRSRLESELRDAAVEILGPARAAIGRINRRYRGQILLKGGLSAEGKRRVGACLEALPSSLKGGSRLELHLDIDPLNLL